MRPHFSKHLSLDVCCIHLLFGRICCFYRTTTGQPIVRGKTSTNLDPFPGWLALMYHESDKMVSKSEAEEIVRIFEQLDVDGDDLVSRTKLEDALEEQGIDNNCVRHILNQVDTNATGIIYLVELKRVLGLPSITEQEWCQLFDELDTDNSGFLTVDEISAIFPEDEQHMRPSADVVRSWIATFDTNNDGLLSREEFLEVIKRRTG
ncbi:hypothetical protein D915_004708 [Fasciola hepatica]|uniref:EF-hand domain-containing protein n=1 Tax=Fasciola hepatica TaxID=6192 RepID=A0A4E0RZF4_FASHE|nr:hypothetical protein D915_004708 [Fasciola hepatica]